MTRRAPRGAGRGIDVRIVAGLLMAGGVLLLVGAGQASDPSGDAPPAASHPPDPHHGEVEVIEEGLAPEARTGGSARFEELYDEAGGRDAFVDDPHTFTCVRCHGAADPVRDEDWRHRCQTEACHPRAWPRTVYHRVDAAAFVDCSNCHVPHRFEADGADCGSCHGDLATDAGEVTVPATLGGGTFPHARHEDLDCARCHATRASHAENILTGAEECIDCHHSADAGAGCGSCHEGGGAIATREVAVDMRVVATPHRREIGFEHERHVDFDCERCHTSPANVREVVACLDCHEDHHQPDRTCRTCHQRPADEVHDLTIHFESCLGSGCHGDTGYTAEVRPRNVCLVCHTDLVDHNPGEDCATCHLVPDPQGGRRMVVDPDAEEPPSPDVDPALDPGGGGEDGTGGR